MDTPELQQLAAPDQPELAAANGGFSGLLDRTLNLISDDVITLVGLMLVGMVFAYLLTNFLKPFLNQHPRQQFVLKVRAVAFILAAGVTALLVANFGPTSNSKAEMIVVILCSLLAGAATPVAFDLFNSWLPALRRPKHERRDDAA